MYYNYYILCGVVAQLIARWIHNDGPGFESRSGHSTHCIIPLSRDSTHTRSRSTQPSHVSVGGQNEEQLCSAATTDTFPRFTSPGPGNLQPKLCQAEGYRNGRSAPNPNMLCRA